MPCTEEKNTLATAEVGGAGVRETANRDFSTAQTDTFAGAKVEGAGVVGGFAGCAVVGLLRSK